MILDCVGGKEVVECAPVMAEVGQFEVLKEVPGSKARLGRLWTAHGPVDTPVFMPVGTQGTVKGLAPWELEDLGCQILLGNTYHLNIRPGMDVIKHFGGLHAFQDWHGAILTDSGGYQVFSLSKLRKMTDDGVWFQSHLDGTRLFMGPRESMEIQRILGSDIAMAFDECPPCPCTKAHADKAVDRTLGASFDEDARTVTLSVSALNKVLMALGYPEGSKPTIGLAVRASIQPTIYDSPCSAMSSPRTP